MRNRPTEFGGKSTSSTIQPKESEALTAPERLRLVYLTGQEDDPKVKKDPKEFLGGR